MGGGGAGTLQNGGSFVAMVSPPGRQLQGGAGGLLGQQVTFVAEKLEGRCLRCAGQKTTAETVSFKLEGALAAHKTLQLWLTNESHHFVSMGNVSASSDGEFSVVVPKDGACSV